MPFHTLITDLVEGQGSSNLLMKILNRLGICSSVDTLSRFFQCKVSSLETQPIPFTNPENFTVVSANNIHFMHSYAQVNVGSTWHGTAFQIVQPLPSLAIERGVWTTPQHSDIQMGTTSHADSTGLLVTPRHVLVIEDTSTHFIPNVEEPDYNQLGKTRKRTQRTSL